MLDPSKNKTADNLSALKTYNHEKGVTCLTIGQIRDTGMPVGGEALIHTADAVFLIEEMGLTSKDMAALWGGQYRDRISIIRAVKSVTTPIFPHPIRVQKNEATGILQVHSAQPQQFRLLTGESQQQEAKPEKVDETVVAKEAKKPAETKEQPIAEDEAKPKKTVRKKKAKKSS